MSVEQTNELKARITELEEVLRDALDGLQTEFHSAHQAGCPMCEAYDRGRKLLGQS